MKFLFKSTVAMLMSGVTVGYVAIAYSVQWDWVLAANKLIEAITSLVS
jgi:hypothetical protein